jgi:hypothetical protein
MTGTRAIAATAMFAGLAVSTASTAWADTPTMSGHYKATSTTPGGQSVTRDWYFTPCGDGCASVADTPGGQPFSQARFVNGQWIDDTTGNATCADGTRVDGATVSHYTWDPNTLAGTVGITYKVPACGQPAGYQWTANLQFTQVP